MPHSFFNRPVLQVAEELIGCYLVRKIDSRVDRYLITETEAYDGFEDKASHAHCGETERNSIMFKSAGHIYVYFTYGMHWMLNIVTGPKDYPAAVLIRCIEGTSGPGRITKKLKINGKLNKIKLEKKTGLWIESGKIPMGSKIKKTARIGVTYAGPEWSKKKYRFVLETK